MSVVDQSTDPAMAALMGRVANRPKLAAAIMDARHPHKKFGALMIASHMAVIGVVIALVMIVDNPFSGQASIDSEIIRSALNR